LSGLTFSKLIQLSSEVETATTGMTLRGSVVNNNLVTTALTPNTNDSFADFSNEIVHFYVLQTPVISITTGASTEYSMIGTGRGNYAWWPTAEDAFANKIGAAATTDAPDVSQNKSWLRDTIVDPLLDVAAAWVPGLGNVAKKLAGMAMNGVGRMIMPAVGNYLAPVRKAIGYQGLQNEAPILFEKAWIIRTLDSLRAQLRQPNLNIFKQDSTNLSDLIDEYYKQIQNWPGPFIPANAFEEKDKDSRFLEPPLLRRKP